MDGEGSIAGAVTARSVHRTATITMLLAPMATAVTGLLYFAIIFTLAFAMGIARTLFIAPLLGSLAAVLVEVPVILSASWFAASRLLRGRLFSLPQRASTGAIAFVLTMVSEAAFSYLMRGQSVMQWAATVATPLGLIGFTAQLGFATMPLLVGMVGPQKTRPRARVI
jgi:hypothetical protein